MAKLVLLCFLSIFFFALTSHAATYLVGDTSGWDISTDLDSWASDKKFNVGDVLMFQYSASTSINEVTRKSYKSCNTTGPLRTYSNGNTTVTLSSPGSKYFISGNRLYCLGGLKLQVNVEGDRRQTTATVDAPEAQPDGATLPRPSSNSKNNNPSTVLPTSRGYIIGGIESLILTFLCLTPTMLLLFQTCK